MNKRTLKRIVKLYEDGLSEDDILRIIIKLSVTEDEAVRAIRSIFKLQPKEIK